MPPKSKKRKSVASSAAEPPGEIQPASPPSPGADEDEDERDEAIDDRGGSQSPFHFAADDDSGDDGEDDLEGLVGDLLNGEIDDDDAAEGATHSAVDALRDGFQPVIVEDERPQHDVDDGHALAEAGDAEELMRWLIAPVPLETFMRDIWERRPAYVSRNAHKGYFDGLLSKADIDQWLRAGKMRYQRNVDVTSYKDGVRRTHNLNDDGSGGVDATTGEPGFADADTVWRRFDQEGCSLRVLHPQRWRDPLWKTLAALERFWNCSTGCNCYLTPADSQGFSPHYDDIDAFILQLEGKKLWRVYPPRSEAEMLPRYSSPNFGQDDVGEPVLEVILEPGDLLYMPRGTVHQANCVPGDHSLHVTLSTNQFNTWADLLEVAFPAALRQAVAEVPALRRCPPPDYLAHLGVRAANAATPPEGGEDAGELVDGEFDAVNPRRDDLVGALVELAQCVMRRLPFDAAADHIGARLMRQRLPPPPSHVSAPASATGANAAATVTDETRVRITQEEGARLVVEDDAVVVCHPFGNGRLLHMEGGDDEDDEEGDEDGAAGEGEGDATGQVAFDLDCGPTLEHLLFDEDCVEQGVVVKDLPLPKEERLELARRLVDAGVLAVVS